MPTSLNKTIGDEDRDELGQFIKDNVSRSSEEEADDVLLKQKIKIVLALLLPRERQVIKLRFGLYDGLVKC